MYWNMPGKQKHNKKHTHTYTKKRKKKEIKEPPQNSWCQWHAASTSLRIHIY
jgi:hypothetical protein